MIKKNIHFLIFHKGLNKSSLGRSVGKTDSAVHGWLKGKKPGYESIKKMAKIIGVTPEQFAEEDVQAIILGIDQLKGDPTPFSKNLEKILMVWDLEELRICDLTNTNLSNLKSYLNGIEPEIDFLLRIDELCDFVFSPRQLWVDKIDVKLIPSKPVNKKK